MPLSVANVLLTLVEHEKLFFETQASLTHVKRKPASVSVEKVDLFGHSRH
jgi:hypothetical protein